MNGVLMGSKSYLPYYAAGKVVSGFGRGSKSLGCPTGIKTNLNVKHLNINKVPSICS